MILEKQDSEVWDISFCRVKYDVNTAIEQAKARNRTDWVTYLKTGRCE
ncbi:hypothetical protein VCRA212O16_380055 [Vibrio crassostreae]|nr:hypothetical protein VCRA212O16_380055 [Vibrio crassostreae]